MKQGPIWGGFMKKTNLDAENLELLSPFKQIFGRNNKLLVQATWYNDFAS
jgi:hypothetical protein